MCCAKLRNPLGKMSIAYHPDHFSFFSVKVEMSNVIKNTLVSTKVKLTSNYLRSSDCLLVIINFAGV